MDRNPNDEIQMSKERQKLKEGKSGQLLFGFCISAFP
jgi:hypothetical protein